MIASTSELSDQYHKQFVIEKLGEVLILISLCMCMLKLSTSRGIKATVSELLLQRLQLVMFLKLATSN